MEKYLNSSIMIIDEDTESMNQYEDLLKQEGYLIVKAETGYDAIDIMLSEKIKLVIINLSIRGMSGADIIKIMKNNEKLSNIVIIVTYSGKEVEQVLDCLNSGADDCLNKTVHNLEKISRIRAALKLYHKNEELKNSKIELESVNMQIQYLSERDGLTGIYNKRYFDIRANEIWRKCSREKRDLAIIILDIDYFKKYNDINGHQKGDDCLKEIAIVMQENLKRPGDFVARYGGEEFIVVLPETDEKGAFYVAENIRISVEKRKILNNPENQENISVSLGVFAAIPNLILTLDMFLINAEEALQKAKKMGRNSVASI